MENLRRCYNGYRDMTKLQGVSFDRKKRNIDDWKSVNC